MSANAKPLVCLVDDDSDLRSAIRLLLKAEGIPLVSYASAHAFLDALEQSKPIGCLLLDVRMPGTSGLDLLETLHERKMAIPVVLLTGHANVATTVQAMRAGAVDVIEKPFRDEDLVAAVQSALALYEKWHVSLQERQIAAQHIAALTRREKQVLDLMVSGLPNRHIAEELGISPKTLDIHRANVMQKMEARTSADLVRARMLDRIDPLALPYLFGDPVVSASEA